MSENELPSQSSDCSDKPLDYLRRAAEACEAGDLELGMHLYLAGYEKASADPSVPDGMALSGLYEAWRLACQLKERSMAEYVFEKLEPYLTAPEIAEYATKLQDLALDRLEEYGFSREDLQDMAEMLSQDIGEGAAVMKVESVSIPNAGMFGVPAVHAEIVASTGGAGSDQEEGPVDEAGSAFASGGDEPAAGAPADEDRAKPATASKKRDSDKGLGMAVADADSFNPYDQYRDYSIGHSWYNATNEGSGAAVFTRDEDRAAAGEAAQAAAVQPASSPAADTADEPPANQATPAPAAADDAGTPAHIQKATPQAEVVPQAQPLPAMPDNAASLTESTLTYANLVGYDGAIAAMRDMGVGLHNDRGYLDFVAMMNRQHGLTRAPALDTVLFRAPVIEDATRFVDATIGEIGLPSLRLSMEDGPQGMPVLCVTTQGNNRPRMNQAHNRFEAPAILVLDYLDTWSMPQVPEETEGVNGWIAANISRGARETFNLIRSAVENPDVYVLATSTTDADVDPVFYDMLEPLTIIDIGLPNEKERQDMWAQIAQDHPSMRSVDSAQLVRFSAGMPRYDIYMAAREALEEAYKIGLVRRGYVPVTSQNLLEKLAACQPLDSDEYRALEDEIIRSFQDDLEHLDDLLSGGAEG